MTWTQYTDYLNGLLILENYSRLPENQNTDILWEHKSYSLRIDSTNDFNLTSAEVVREYDVTLEVVYLNIDNTQYDLNMDSINTLLNLLKNTTGFANFTEVSNGELDDRYINSVIKYKLILSY